MNINKVTLMGRLTKDPEIRYSNAAEPMAIARFTLAVSRRFTREGEPDADFLNITAFRKTAEFVEKFFKKGMCAIVHGSIQVRTFDDNTGKRQWFTEIIADDITFGESRASFEGRNQGGQSGGYDNAPPQAPAPRAQQQPPQSYGQPQPPSNDFFEVDNSMDDDDLPF
ncbi:MAG: single-stranded DNA-binding protein [Defluviitaleaceae bacterium]|nr:single-stranded DNA-binding protein [Defluviitaleaceae bacterium]